MQEERRAKQHVTIRRDERPIPSHEGVDIVYDHNNGTIAINPTRSGLLAKLVLTYNTPEKDSRDGNERVWVFANFGVWKDDDGNEYVDHHTRGLTCGNYDDGRVFLAMCRRIGLNVQRRGMFVPLSNGQRRHSRFDDGEWSADYTDDEWVCVRWDLPSEQTLRDTAMEKLLTTTWVAAQ